MNPASRMALLTQRGITLSAAQAEDVRSCQELSLLARWAARATVITTADELFPVE